METHSEFALCQLEEIPEGSARGFALERAEGKPLRLIVGARWANWHR